MDCFLKKKSARVLNLESDHSHSIETGKNEVGGELDPETLAFDLAQRARTGCIRFKLVAILLIMKYIRSRLTNKKCQFN